MKKSKPSSRGLAKFSRLQLPSNAPSSSKPSETITSFFAKLTENTKNLHVKESQCDNYPSDITNSFKSGLELEATSSKIDNILNKCTPKKSDDLLIDLINKNQDDEDIKSNELWCNELNNSDEFTTPTTNAQWQFKIKPKKSNKNKKDQKLAPSNNEDEDLQVAIAMSRSLLVEESASNENKTNKPTTLEQFGYSSKPKLLNSNPKIVKQRMNKKKSTKFKYVTPVLLMRTEADRQNITQKKIYDILLEASKAQDPEEKEEIVVNSDYLSGLANKERSIFNKNYANEDIFRVSTLSLDIQGTKAGNLLKDWSKIPGRSPSPELIFSNAEKLMEDKVQMLISKSKSEGKLSELRSPSPDLFASYDECYLETLNSSLDTDQTDYIAKKDKCEEHTFNLTEDSSNDTVIYDALEEMDHFSQLNKENEHKLSCIMGKYELQASQKSLNEIAQDIPENYNIIKLSEKEDNAYKSIDSSTCNHKNSLADLSDSRRFQENSFSDKLYDNLFSEIVEPSQESNHKKKFSFKKSSNNMIVSPLKNLDSSDMTIKDDNDVLNNCSEEDMQNSYLQNSANLNVTDYIQNLLSKNRSFIADSFTNESAEIEYKLKTKTVSATNKIKNGSFCNPLDIHENQVNNHKQQLSNCTIEMKKEITSNANQIASNNSINAESSMESSGDELVTNEDLNYSCGFGLKSSSKDIIELSSDDDENPKCKEINYQESSLKKNWCTNISILPPKNNFKLTLDLANIANNVTVKVLPNSSTMKYEAEDSSDMNIEETRTVDAQTCGNIFKMQHNTDLMEAEPPRKLIRKESSVDKNTVVPRRGRNKEVSLVDAEVEQLMNSIAPFTNDYNSMSKNVTPPPDFDRMSSPELKKQLDKYYIKLLDKEKSKKILKYLYDATHPVVRLQRKDILKHQNASSLTDKLNDKKIGNIEIVDDLLNSEDPSDLIFERTQSKTIASCRLPLQIAWHNFLSLYPEIKESILFYEPIQLEVIHQMLKDLGHKYHKEDLILFFDKKCITVRINKPN